MKKLLCVLTLFLSSLAVASAGNDTVALFQAPTPTATSLFGNETQLNLSGTYRDPAAAGFRSNPSVDFGVTHFFNEIFGVRGTVSWVDKNEPWNWMLSADALVRYPFEDLRIAPYVFGGGGGTVDGLNRGFGQIGAGIDYRPFANDQIKLFVEGGYQWFSNYNNTSVIRAGLGFVF